MGEDTAVYQQLHKLTGIKSEEAVDHILSTLWKTRKTGLRSPEKSHIQSLLNLPSLPELDPVCKIKLSLFVFVFVCLLMNEWIGVGMPSFAYQKMRTS